MNRLPRLPFLAVVLSALIIGVGCGPNTLADLRAGDTPPAPKSATLIGRLRGATFAQVATFITQPLKPKIRPIAAPPEINTTFGSSPAGTALMLSPQTVVEIKPDDEQPSSKFNSPSSPASSCHCDADTAFHSSLPNLDFVLIYR